MAFGGDTTILFLPGLRDHVEDHWQTHAAREIPGAVTVAPVAAERLSRARQVAALDAALRAIPGEVVVVAHSAGCLIMVHWALAPTRTIRAALLVTPADIENPLPAGYPEPGSLKDGGWLKPDTMLVLEESSDAALDLPVGFALDDRREYGAAAVHFLSLI